MLSLEVALAGSDMVVPDEQGGLHKRLESVQNVHYVISTHSGVL